MVAKDHALTLQDAILDPSPSIRTAAAEAMGMLSGLAGSHYLSSQVQWLVDQVVNNRVPDSRAGCALAFGAIYSSVGGSSRPSSTFSCRWRRTRILSCTSGPWQP
jgi:hypothetical protein